MILEGRVFWKRVVFQALAAGLVGAVVIDLYLWATMLLPHGQGIGVLWRWIASTVFGKPALAQPNAASVGAIIHAIVSIGWAGGYAYVAATRPATTRRWIVAGIVYGLIVYTIMQVILLADNNFTYPPTPNDFVNALVAHSVFFGIPVSYIVHVMQVRRS